MPLPEAKTAWPPREHALLLDRMVEHDAWYSGDLERLERFYRNDQAGRPVDRPSQLRGGIAGRLARMWYGKPTGNNGRPTPRVHAGAPGDLATAGSVLLFADPPRLGPVDEANTGAQQRLDELAELCRLDARMGEGAEVCSALGGVFLRAWWDRELAPHPLSQVVHPDQAYPQIVGGVLRSVTFVRVVLDENAIVRRHIERHEPDGTVLHGLYEGTRDNLGRRLALTDDPATAAFPDVVPSLGMLLVSYVPNWLPNPVDRGSWLGRSDFLRSEGLFDFLDETLTSWRRDVRLAKARLVVPDGYVSSLGPGKGGAFDTDREVYEQINMPPMSGANAQPITLAQFAIRVEEHRASCEYLLGRIVSNAHYALASFGLDDTSTAAATATEIKERKERTLRRRDKQIGYWRPAREHHARALLRVDAAQFGGRFGDVPVRDSWPDGVTVDLLTLAQTAAALRGAEAASDDTIVRVVHPDWPDDRVQTEVAAIAAARPPLLPDMPGSDLP